MLYVFKLTIAAGTKIRDGFEVFSNLSDARRVYHAAQAKVRPGDPILNCALYVTDASDKIAVVEAVQLKVAQTLNVERGSDVSPDEPALFEMIERLSGSKRETQAEIDQETALAGPFPLCGRSERHPLGGCERALNMLLVEWMSPEGVTGHLACAIFAPEGRLRLRRRPQRMADGG